MEFLIRTVFAQLVASTVLCSNDKLPAVRFPAILNDRGGAAYIITHRNYFRAAFRMYHKFCFRIFGSHFNNIFNREHIMSVAIAFPYNQLLTGLFLNIIAQILIRYPDDFLRVERFNHLDGVG
ncbi:hypothetical protein D3C74_384480 [compost metagenome]